MSRSPFPTHTATGPTIALLNLNEDKHAFTRHPTIPAYVRGIRQRAAIPGYAVDLFTEPAAAMD